MESKKKILQYTQAGCFTLVILSVLLFNQSGIAQTTSDTTQVQFGGPGSVQGQTAEDAKQNETLTNFGALQRYFNWKDKLREKNALSYTVDYTSAVLTATNTINNENIFASGTLRFYGLWSPVGRKSGNTGSFVWKVEHRHKYTKLGTSNTASEIGYVGLFLLLSDIKLRLTNLYWKQNLIQGKLEIVAGFIDVTDWVDIYALASPWNSFFNLGFSTGDETMFLPDDATIGAYVNAMITKNVYVSAGLSDANAISTDPFKGFETFFNDREYFTSLELGWIQSQDRYYYNNTHITLWHVDARKNAGTKEAWGLNFSASHGFGVKWIPFLRAGISYKGGANWFLQKSVCAGLGYHLKDGISLFGLGLNWSQPNEDTYGEKLKNQFATEIFCRIQVLSNFELSPSINWIINPALNPNSDQSWVFGLRSRMFF